MLPTEDHIRRRGKQIVLVLEGSRFVIDVVTQFGSHDDGGARLELDAGGQSRIQSRKTRALALNVVEEFETGRRIELGCQLVRQIIDDAEPLGRSEIGNVRGAGR
jgi:hypothetical protein